MNWFGTKKQKNLVASECDGIGNVLHEHNKRCRRRRVCKLETNHFVHQPQLNQGDVFRMFFHLGKLFLLFVLTMREFILKNVSQEVSGWGLSDVSVIGLGFPTSCYIEVNRGSVFNSVWHLTRLYVGNGQPWLSFTWSQLFNVMQKPQTNSDCKKGVTNMVIELYYFQIKAWKIKSQDQSSAAPCCWFKKNLKWISPASVSWGFSEAVAWGSHIRV